MNTIGECLLISSLLGKASGSLVESLGSERPKPERTSDTLIGRSIKVSDGVSGLRLYEGSDVKL